MTTHALVLTKCTNTHTYPDTLFYLFFVGGLLIVSSFYVTSAVALFLRKDLKESLKTFRGWLQGQLHCEIYHALFLGISHTQDSAL